MGSETSTETRQEYLSRHVEEIHRAAERIAPYVRHTPLLTADLHPELRLKPELFQVTGAFKARGAFNAALALREREGNVRGVTTVSSGNHAQALALAARTAGLQAAIVIPADANPLKVAATRGYGAEVIQEGVTFANREEHLRRVAEERGLTVIHPYDNWDVIHGAATAAHEALADDPSIGTVVTPVGGGGLLSGTALAVKSQHPEVQVIGAEPAAADDGARTLETRQVQRLPDSPATLADGVRTISVGRRTFEVMVTYGLVDGIVRITEEEIAEATRTAWLQLKVAVEPTAALPLAAWLAGKLPRTSGSICLLLSGGNFNPTVVARILAA
ncbi:MAG: threonine/serine dehydratase [Candidatus Dormibacteraeota bacterium]|nr:threonine/serine dehydratase [Candidatus Dormibacteraeota bacterium]